MNKELFKAKLADDTVKVPFDDAKHMDFSNLTNEEIDVITDHLISIKAHRSHVQEAETALEEATIAMEKLKDREFTIGEPSSTKTAQDILAGIRHRSNGR